MKNDINNISSVLNLEDEENRIIKLPLLLGDITEWCKDTFAKNKNNPTQQIVLINQLNATLKSVNMNLASILEQEHEILALAQDQTQVLKENQDKYNDIVERVKSASEQAKAIEELQAAHEQKEEELDILENKLQWTSPTELDALIADIDKFAKDKVPSYGAFKRCKAEFLSNIPSIQEKIKQFSRFLEKENKEKIENLNSQLEDLKNQKEESDKKLETLDELKEKYEKEIKDLKSKKNELQGENKKLTDKIDTLQKALEEQKSLLSTSQNAIKVLENDIEETRQKIEDEEKNLDVLDKSRQVLVKHYENNRRVAEAIAAGNFPPRIQAAIESTEKSLEEFDSAIREQLDLGERGLHNAEFT